MASHVMKLIQLLYAIEDLPVKSKCRMSSGTLYDWRKRCASLTRLVSTPEIDSNLVENSIHTPELGRKNYLFAGSHSLPQSIGDAAEDIAMFYSFFLPAPKTTSTIRNG